MRVPSKYSVITASPGELPRFVMFIFVLGHEYDQEFTTPLLIGLLGMGRKNDCPTYLLKLSAFADKENASMLRHRNTVQIMFFTELNLVLFCDIDIGIFSFIIFFYYILCISHSDHKSICFPFTTFKFSGSRCCIMQP